MLGLLTKCCEGADSVIVLLQVQTYLRERGSNLKVGTNACSMQKSLASFAVHFLVVDDSIQRVLLLIDARYGFKPADVEFLKSITGPSMRK
jgi:hypothetical protein